MDTEQEKMKEGLEAHLKGVCSFLKQAFATDGEATTDGKECIIIGQDGSKLKGVTFVLNDSERGKFMVTLSNPVDLEEKSEEDGK